MEEERLPHGSKRPTPLQSESVAKKPMRRRVSPGVWALMATVFLLTSLAAFSFYYYLQNYERNQAQKLLTSASETLQDRVQSELDQEVLVLKRIADRWNDFPEMDIDRWAVDVEHALQDHRDLSAIAWLENTDPGNDDPASIVNSWKVSWCIPAATDAGVKKLHGLIVQNRTKLFLDVVKNRRMRVTDPMLVADRGKMFALYIPSVVNGKLRGVTLGLFHVQVLMASIFERILAKDYSIKLLDGYQEIFTHGDPKNDPADWEFDGTLKTFDTIWQMRLWPNPERQREKERSALAVLIYGNVLAVLLSFLVFFVAMRSAVSTVEVIPAPGKESGEVRRRSEDRLRVWEAAISNIDEAIFVTEAEVVMGSGTPILFANQAFERLTGICFSEIVGKTPRILFQHSHDKSGYEALNEAMHWSHPSSVTVSIPRPTGEVEKFDIRVKPVLDSSNKVTHYILMLRTQPAPVREPATPVPAETSSATAAPLAAEAPVASEAPAADVPTAATPAPPAPEIPALPATPSLSTAALLESLLAATPLAVQVLDADGIVLSWNKRAEEVTGFPPEETVGHYTRVPVEFPAPGVWHRQQLQLQQKSGERLDLHVWTAPLQEPDAAPGAPARWMSFMADVTQENLAQEDLARRESSFRSLVDHAADVLAVLDLDSTFHYVNPAVERVLGLTPQEVVGQQATELVEKSDVPAALRSLAEAKLGAGPSRPRTLHVRHRDGSLREVESVINLIEGSSLAVMTARDVTGRTRPEVPEVSPAWFLNAVQDAIVTFDTEHRVIWMNRAAEDLYGLSSAIAQGKTIGELLPDWLQVPSHEQIREALDTTGYWKGEVSNYTPSGKEIVQDVSITSTYDAQNLRIGAVSIHRDITEKKSAVEAMRLNEKTKTLDAIGHSDGLWDWNLRTDEVYFSPRWKEMLGYSDEDIAGELGEWEMMVHPDDLAHLKNRIQNHLKGHSEHLEAEYRIRTKSGDFHWMLARAMAIRNAEGEATRLVGLQIDIQGQKEMEEHLLFEAFHDSVTGLANRALFLDHVNGLLAQRPHPFTVAFMDLEQFAAVNDALGTRGGDKALAEAGKRISAALPAGSFVARHSSDEFVALIPTVNESELRKIVDLLRYQLGKPFEFQGKTATTRLNIGLALSTHHQGSNGEDMLQTASRVMAAVRLGKAESTLQTATAVDTAPPHVEAPTAMIAEAAPPTESARTEDSTAPEVQMREAMENGEFRVFYHPIITLESGEIAGIEALVRWQHSTRGLLTPKDFLPLAEASGLILDLDRWVLSEACAKATEMNLRFRRAEPLVLTVNLSSLHFADESFTARLEEILSASAINHRYLRIEIAGRLVMHPADPEAMLRNLGRLRVQLNLDDFNDSADSLASLSRLPVDRVKLDASLVRGLSTGRSLEKIRSIIGSANALNLEVVAEGVETLEQLAVLRELKCHLAQGFYFTMPASAGDTERLIARGPRW